MTMPSKIAKFLLVSAFATLMFPGGCKDSITTSDAFSKPVIWLSTFRMQFSASVFGPDPSEQVLLVKNVGQGNLEYTIEDDANFYEVDWLEVIPTSGSSNGNTQEHVVSVNKQGLAARANPYTAKITVSSTDAYNTPQRVDVSLTLIEQRPPVIEVSPKSLDFSARLGGPNPVSKSLTVGNQGEADLDYEISSDVPWAEVTPASGSAGEGEQNTHSVSVDTTSLGVGTYSGTITVSDSHASNNPQTVTVNLEITEEPPPEIGLSTTQLSFSVREGGSAPSSQSFQVSNTGEGTLDYQITWDAAWLNVAPSSGTTQGPPRTHTVSVNTTGLGAGTYQGTITVADPAALNSPQTVSVTLRITTQPPPATDNAVTLAVSPTSGSTGTTVTVTIGVKGNLQPIQAFGMDLTFDSSMFSYVGFNRGNLSGYLTDVRANNPSAGVVKIGGYGVTNSIPAGSTGTLIIVRLRVTCGSCNDGLQRQICITRFTDDIEDMIKQPGCRTFTYRD